MKFVPAPSFWLPGLPVQESQRSILAESHRKKSSEMDDNLSTEPRFGCRPQCTTQMKAWCENALSILWRQTNRSTQNRLPRPQFVSPPALCILRIPLQYPRKASTLEPRGTEVAGAATISERMEERADIGAAREVRGGVLWSRFQAGWNKPPCGPHCAGEADPAIKSRQSGSSREPSVYLRDLPWIQTAGGPQTLPGQ